MEAATNLDGTGSGPSPGSITICIKCGATHQFGPGLELLAVDVAALPEMGAEQLAQIRHAQAIIRGEVSPDLRRLARESIPKPKLDPSYVAACERATDRARAWLAAHETHDGTPRFRLPAPEIMLIAPLDAMEPRICGNKPARRLLRHLLEGDPELTVFMLRTVLAMLGIAAETVALSELGLGTGGVS
jgi:hypothetical protein